ncbi:hypothetical protein UIA24_19890 [Pseudomonas sp. AL 58]|uniref:hypothetical protein n=1 Tax=Pseudomonas sp. AL 58 TaxID=3104275 RepID=UPI002EA3E699|nr:hypothetical protein [Pseudomonas sp. AL 58]
MENRTNKLLGLAGILGALLIALVSLFYAKNFRGDISGSQEIWGQFGDYFGGILNPILSFFAFCALLYTVHLQLQSSREAEARHDEQIFDSRLFKILSVSFELGLALRLQDINPSRIMSFDGLRAVNYSWHVFSTQFISDVDVKTNPVAIFKAAKVRLEQLKRLHGSVVWAYLDSVGFALDFSLRSSINPAQTTFALNALRSQMTSGGRGLLFYYLLCSEERCRYLPALMATYYFDDVVDDPLAEHRQNLFAAAAAFHQA